VEDRLANKMKEKNLKLSKMRRDKTKGLFKPELISKKNKKYKNVKSSKENFYSNVRKVKKKEIKKRKYKIKANCKNKHTKDKINKREDCELIHDNKIDLENNQTLNDL